MSNACEECTRDLEEREKEYIAICKQVNVELEVLSRLPLEHETNMILIRNLRTRYPRIGLEEFSTKLESLDIGMSIRDGCTDHDLSTVLTDYRDIMERQRRGLMENEICKYFGHSILSRRRSELIRDPVQRA